MRLVVLCAFLIACGGGSPEPSATAGGESTDNARGAGDDFAVTLVSAGEGERTLLRYRFTAGTVARATGRVDSTMRARIDGTQGELETMPTMTMAYTVETTERVGDGVRYRFRYDDLVFSAGSDPTVDARMTELLAPLERATGLASVDARGRVTDLDIEVPPDLAPELSSMVGQLEDTIRQIVAPLPEEAVAVGAVWTHESPIHANGLSMVQRATYRLVSREGDRIVLAVETEVRAQPGPLPGAEGATLLSLTGRGSGSTVLRLDRLLPEMGSISVQLTEEAAIANGPQTLPMHLEVTMRVETAAVP